LQDKKKKGRCHRCGRRRLLNKCHYFASRENSFKHFNKIRFLPFSIWWWLLFKKVKDWECEECYIASNNSVFPLGCKNCDSIIFIRYQDFSRHNRKRQGIKRLKDGESMELTEDDMVCPYCHSEALVELSYMKGGKDEQKEV